MGHSADITVLLKGIRDGEKDCEAKLMEAVYGELRKLAASRLRNERREHTLQPSALVNEAYLRMMNGTIDSNGRAHFFSLAANVMRHILVDYARAKRAQRRQGGVRVDMQFAGAIAVDRPAEMLDLDAALSELATLNDRHSQVVNLHFFGGLTFEEIGELLNISSRTAKRDWDLARSWLQIRMKGSGDDT